MEEVVQVSCEASSDAILSALFSVLIAVEEVIQVDYEPPVKRRKLQAGASPVSKTRSSKTTRAGLGAYFFLGGGVWGGRGLFTLVVFSKVHVCIFVC